MVIDFSQVDLRDRPVLVLRDIDGTAIQTLGYAFNIKADGLCYNETSSISFDVPAYVNGEKTPHYDDIVGMRIIDIVGWGQFELVNPEISKEGVREVKSCKAYSLEYEFTKKKITLPESTYNFWNPMTPESTVLGIIMSYMPGWKIGTVDEVLWGKYRTFSVSNENVYNFAKSTVQETYGCVFDFDVYTRTVNVIATSTLVATKPVYISCGNLAKEINVEEDTENIFTVLDVNGAEGVSIRSVNPTGNNKIYNLDYFIEHGLMPVSLAEKWKNWKSAYESYQTEYYYSAIERMIKTSEILVEQENLREMREVTLGTLEAQRSTTIEYIATLSNTSSEEYAKWQEKLSGYNAQIAEVEGDILEQEAYVKTLQTEKDDLTSLLAGINDELEFSKFFTPDELVILDRFFIEESIEDSSFVYSTVTAYEGADLSYKSDSSAVSLTNAIVDKHVGDKTIYTMSGGKLTVAGEATLSAELISGTLEAKSDGNFVFTALLNSGKLENTSFPKGCLSMTGSISGLTDDAESEDGVNSVLTGTSLSFTGGTVRVFFTANTTEYEQFSVEWDLYQYGVDCGRKLAYPSYKFKVSSANFLALDDFRQFASQLELGKKVYLELSEGKVLEPILVKVSVDFDDLTSLELEFGDTYSLSDSSFSLVDLLEKSVSMGRTVDTNRFGYNSFIDSGASTAVKDFMEAALDLTKNKILSSGNMATTWDDNGLWLRKWTDESKSSYEPTQVAIINDSILFTTDGWATVKMALGRISDSNTGDVWGLVAPSIVGTLLAGENLVIESVKKDGGVSVFKVDADGAVLHNATFDIENGVSHIMLDPEMGFAIGAYPVLDIDGDGNKAWNEDNAKFWVDTEGNIHFKGNLEGATGYFSGTVQALDFLDANGDSILNANGKISSNYLDLGNIQLDGDTGDITMTGNINLSGASSIIWSSDNSPVKALYAVTSLSTPAGSYSSYPTSSATDWHTTLNTNADYYVSYSYDGGSTWTSAVRLQGKNGTNGSDADVPGYIQSTYIDATSIESFHIKGNKIEAVVPEGSLDTGFILTSSFNNKAYQYLRMYAYDYNVNFTSPGGFIANWDFETTYFHGVLDYSGAEEVIGLYMTFS